MQIAFFKQKTGPDYDRPTAKLGGIRGAALSLSVHQQTRVHIRDHTCHQHNHVCRAEIKREGTANTLPALASATRFLRSAVLRKVVTESSAEGMTFLNLG